MSAPTYNGGPAFPISDTFHPDYTGMSLRDWFAGQALAGELATMFSIDRVRAMAKVAKEDRISESEVLAGMCYAYADAMLAARKEITK